MHAHHHRRVRSFAETRAADHRRQTRQPRRTPQPQDGHSRGTMTAAGFVDPELRDRAQPAGQSIRACTGLLGLARPTSQGRDLGIDDDCSWAWDLRSTQTMVAITWAPAKSCLCTFSLFHSGFGRLASRLLCVQPHRLPRIIHNHSQIGLDYFEFSGEHGNVLREILDYLPRPLNLLRGPTPNYRYGL